jgi:hypothetical protein
MDNVMITIIEGITVNYDDSIEEHLNNTAFLFDKYLGIGQDLTRNQQIGQLGWTNVIADMKITEEDISCLRDALIKFIQNNEDSRHIGLAVWSLGKLRDPSTKSVLVKVLRALC